MGMLWFLLLAGVLSWLLTSLLRRYALANSLLDIPNKRSSHFVPTPRGGGVSIVLSFMIVLPFLSMFDVLPTEQIWALLGAGGCVAFVGFLDDHRHIPALWRLLVHFVCAAWALVWLDGLPPLPVFNIMFDFGWLGNLLAVLYLVWLLNLYNFMDGIDGIASIEAITVCLGGIVLYWLSGVTEYIWVVPALLMTAVAGFLFWNFPRAKIFMGDTGSGFLGLVLGVLSIQAARVVPELFWAWVILLGAFVVDASLTLIIRIFRGEMFYEAHRTHAYQHAARKYNNHILVTAVFGAINLFWLLPIAIFVVYGWLDGFFGTLIAYFPLIFLATFFGAGQSETNAKI